MVAQVEETVTVGTSAQTKPYNYFTPSGELTGFEIEMLQEIDKRLEDYGFKYETTEFASLFAGVDAGKIDMIANWLGEMPGRREKYLFSLYS
ncbi:transporter substrate-binding domain-containing protein [Streptococcus sp. X13SY08]|uniref:transporter substrate-binding domain-containing protein n=1 Tax=Streptococcus sp. X13SY08 TaxID=1676616 RepID=UPI0009E74550|nr:transporter substrate-binding domain-containing protein [Streptococcus sp. X13SY08]